MGFSAHLTFLSAIDKETSGEASKIEIWEKYSLKEILDTLNKNNL